MKILITGGTGFIGIPVINTLIRNIDNVEILNLTRNTLDSNSKQLENYKCDLSSSKTYLSRVEDFEIVKKLEIPSETGKPEVITLTQNKATGNITIESNSGGVADSPFEISYTPPKTDINVHTGEPVKYPGDFYVVENRPKPDYNNPGKVEFDYDTFDIDTAYSDLERLEKIGTGKIKDAKKIEQRAAGRKKVEDDPYDDIMDRYPDPDPSNYRADGGLASFANGGLTKTVPPVKGPNSQGVETLFRRRYS